jgi:hypothetical protein
MSDEPTKPEPPRCTKHGLVTGPDGRCVLCRRASPVPPPATQQARSSVLPIVAAVVLVLGAVGAFALYRLRSSPNEPSVSAPKAEPAGRLVAKDRPPMTVRLRPRTSPPGPPPPSAPPMARRIAPRPAPPAPAPSSADKDEQEALAARARMNQMYARAARQSGDKQVQIIMYMTSW